jgi:hypothetical protein
LDQVAEGVLRETATAETIPGVLICGDEVEEES